MRENMYRSLLFLSFADYFVHVLSAVLPCCPINRLVRLVPGLSVDFPARAKKHEHDEHKARAIQARKRRKGRPGTAQSSSYYYYSVLASTWNLCTGSTDNLHPRTTEIPLFFTLHCLPRPNLGGHTRRSLFFAFSLNPSLQAPSCPSAFCIRIRFRALLTTNLVSRF